MRLDNGFTVPVSIDAAWDMLLDVEQLAPCMPGATLDSIDGDIVKGRVKVKIGPITTTYQGTLTFLERDRSVHRVVLQAGANEMRGNGTANATVTALLTDNGDSTTVSVATDLQITGKAAQFGRGVLAEISGRIIDQFAENLANSLRGGPGSSAEPAAGAGSGDRSAARAMGGSNRTGPTSTREPLDLVSTVSGPLLKRARPVLGAAIAFIALAWLLRRLAGRG